MVVEKTVPVSYGISDQLTSSVKKAHAEHLRTGSIEEWKIPATERLLRKILLAAQIDASDFDSESEVEKADWPSCAQVSTSGLEFRWRVWCPINRAPDYDTKQNGE